MSHLLLKPLVPTSDIVTKLWLLTDRNCMWNLLNMKQKYQKPNHNPRVTYLTEITNNKKNEKENTFLCPVCLYDEMKA